MSLVEHFLPKHLQTASNIKYFHSLLSLPHSKLFQEKDALQERIELLENQIRLHSVQESKEFVVALESSSDLIEISSSLNSLLNSCLSATNSFKSQVLSQSSKIESILSDQQKLENLSNLQSVISDIMEIPHLLKNLLNSKHYKEALDLLLFSEKIQAEGHIFSEIRQASKDSRLRIFRDLRLLIVDLFDSDKMKENFRLLSLLDPQILLKDLFFNCKLEYFRENVKRQKVAHVKLLETLNFLGVFLEKFLKVCQSLWEENELSGFYLDLISDVFEMVDQYSFSSLSELSEVTSRLDQINKDFFIHASCDIWPGFFGVVERTVNEKLQVYRKKTLINFENLLKLYGWQVSPNQASPLQEFGSIAVLYNNCLTIINEVRSEVFRKIPVVSCKEKFFEEISLVLKGAAFVVKEKCKNFNQGKNLNKQEELMKGLMKRYIECLNSKAFPEVIKLALETYENPQIFEKTLVFLKKLESCEVLSILTS